MKPSEPIRIPNYSIQDLQNDRDYEYDYESQFHRLIKYIHEEKLCNNATQEGVVAKTANEGTVNLSYKQKEVLKWVFNENNFEINYCQHVYCQEQIELDEVYEIEYCSNCMINDEKR